MFPIKPSFTAGELSPMLYGRVDLNQYNLGAKTIRNFICHGHGGVSNRPGMAFICNCDGNKTYRYPPRLIPFQFSTKDAYVLVFLEEEIWPIKEGQRVYDRSNPVVIPSPYLRSELYDIDYAQSADMLFLVHTNHPPMQLSRYSDIDWTLEEFDFIDGPYATRKYGDDKISLSPKGRKGIVTVTSNKDFFSSHMIGKPLRFGYPDTEDPTDIRWGWGKVNSVADAKSAQVNIVEPLGYELVFNGEFAADTGGWEDHSTQQSELTYDPLGPYAVLTHTGYVAGQLEGYGMMAQEIEYFPVKVVAKLTVQATISTGGHMRVQAGYNANGSQLLKRTVYVSGEHNFEFTTPKSGKLLYITIDNRYGADGDKIEVSYVSLIRSNLSTNEWRRPAWTSRLATGFPEHITFFEQRLCFAATRAEPQTIWMSMTGNFYNYGFISPGADDDAITYTLASRKIDSIQWMEPFTELIIGTYSSIWKLSAGGQTDVITPTSITARAQSGHGCSRISPLTIGSSMLYLQRGETNVRDLSYSLELDGFSGKDLSVMSHHLFETRKIISWDYAGLHDSIVWCVTDDGALLGMTYLPEHEVNGWHRHDTLRGKFKDVCVLIGEQKDEVYFLVQRYQWTQEQGGYFKPQHYVEYLADRITRRAPPLGVYKMEARSIAGRGFVENIAEYEEKKGLQRLVYEDSRMEHKYVFLDSCITYEGGLEIYISGLDHLENHKVGILADGSVVPSQTVRNGRIILDTPAQVVIVGLAYESILETLDLEIVDNQGSSQGRTKAVNRVTLKVHHTRGGEVGPRGTDQLERIDELRIRDALDGSDPIALRTGFLDLTLNSGWEQTGGLIIRNRDPVPLTVLAIVPEVTLAER